LDQVQNFELEGEWNRDCKSVSYRQSLAYQEVLMAAAKQDVPVERRRSKIFGVLFWVFSIAVLAGAVIVAVTMSDLHRGLVEARRQRDVAQMQLADLQGQLKQSEGEIDKLCIAAVGINSALASPKYAQVRTELGDDILNRSGNISSIACGNTEYTH
jgi:hypothetical protein